jgi:hypothetical protein
MKTKIYQPLTKNAIPDGEGFIALPISFNSVIARRAQPDEAISNMLNEIGSPLAPLRGVRGSQ